VGQGFTVDAVKLQAGSREASSLLRQSAGVAADAVSALMGIAGSAGHPGLSSALAQAVSQGSTAFAGLALAYQHAGTSLATSAEVYLRAERGIAARASGLFERPQWQAW